MFLVRVVPLVRLPATAPSVLDYFWNEALPMGCIVRVQMGRRAITALVLESRDVRTAKLSLKRADFELKRLTAVVTTRPQLSRLQIRLAEWLAVQYACSLATAIHAVAPAFIGKPRSRLDVPDGPSAPSQPPRTGTVLLTQPDTARQAIRNVIRTRDRQVLILVPDLQILDSLRSGLPDGSLQLHSALSARDFRGAYRSIMDGSARVVIGTRSALFAPWHDLGHIIVEDPLNESYKSDSAPRYNGSEVVRHLAALHGAEVTWLTPSLSTVQHHMATMGQLVVENRKPSWPIVSLTTSQTESEAGNSAIFSREAREAILEAHEARRSLLVFSARRAYATAARCTRCRHAARCTTCDIPMRWHRTTEDMLICYQCAAYRAVPKQCESCHAGVLKASGVPGSQKLAEAVNVVLDRAGFDKQRIPILDSDLITERSESARVFAALDAMTSPLLVATAMIFGHRYDRQFDTVIVPSVDMLASSPDYRAHDRLILQLEKIADFRPKRVVLQSFEDTDIAHVAVERAWDRFFTGELMLRKSLRWPPYSRIVKLSTSHRDRVTARRAATTGADRLRRATAHLGLTGVQVLGPAPALIEHGNGRWTHHLIIKHTLSPQRIVELLQYVPTGWTIDVDPRSIA